VRFRTAVAPSVALAANPAGLLAHEMEGLLNSLPERVTRTVVRARDDPEAAQSLRTFLEAVVPDRCRCPGFPPRVSAS